MIDKPARYIEGSSPRPGRICCPSTWRPTTPPASPNAFRAMGANGVKKSRDLAAPITSARAVLPYLEGLDMVAGG